MVACFQESTKEAVVRLSLSVGVSAALMGSCSLLKMKCGQGSNGAPERIEHMVEVISVAVMAGQQVIVVSRVFD